MTYQLPEPALPNCVIGKDSTMRQIRLDCYTEAQMQAAYQAGRDASNKELATLRSKFAIPSSVNAGLGMNALRWDDQIKELRK